MLYYIASRRDTQLQKEAASFASPDHEISQVTALALPDLGSESGVSYSEMQP